VVEDLRALAFPGMASPSVAPERVEHPDVGTDARSERPWIVIVWNDPINLMSYVTWVFQKLFGYSHAKATKLMLEVHHNGRSVVSSGPREKAELDCFRLHAHGLWATIAHSD
jgi:ATP-dependent Clp protease adaptor protein ClpS